MYRESNADSANRVNTYDGPSGSGDGYAAYNNEGRGRGNGRNRRNGGRNNRGGASNRGAPAGPYKPEKFGIGYDVRRNPAHLKERIGKVGVLIITVKMGDRALMVSLCRCATIRSWRETREKHSAASGAWERPDARE